MYEDEGGGIIFMLVLQRQEGGIVGLLEVILFPCSKKDVWSKRTEAWMKIEHDILLHKVQPAEALSTADFQVPQAIDIFA